jgi:Ulp1 family protease
MGPIQGGYWALLVIDRTEYKQGIVVYFDSLPGFDKKMFDKAKSLLELCGFSGCKWIRATMPKQGCGTNDCGVWMCCLASIYAKSVFSRAVPSQTQETVVPFRNVTLSLVNGMIRKEFGLAGRETEFGREEKGSLV